MRWLKLSLDISAVGATVYDAAYAAKMYDVEFRAVRIDFGMSMLSGYSKSTLCWKRMREYAATKANTTELPTTHH